MYNNFVIISSALLLLLCNSYGTLAAQPTYQVSIYLSVHPRAPLVHICNGVILQRRIILTTASCVQADYMQSLPATITSAASVGAVEAERLRVVAGQTNVVDETAAFSVAEVHVISTFNATALTDDLAILKLKHGLPLGLRDDMKWILPDDSEQKKDQACTANFHARNSLDGIPDYMQTEDVLPQSPQKCGVDSAEHLDDVCGHYLLPYNFDCEQYEDFKRFNADRGTGLVCNSRLVALLSYTMPLSNDIEFDINCSERKVQAIYTTMAPHNEWIYQYIMSEEYKDIKANTYIPSLPYDENEPSITTRPGLAGIASTTDMDTTTEAHTTRNNNNNNNEHNNNNDNALTIPHSLPTLPTLNSNTNSSSGSNSSSRHALTLLLPSICLLLLPLLQRQLNSSSNSFAL